MKIAVLMGGYSSEREISLRTGNAILNSLLRMNYDAYGIDLKKDTMLEQLINNDYDLAFIALHGEYGEDGRVQAVLDILGRKYTGCGFLQSAVSMDKDFTKKLLSLEGIKIPKTYPKIDEIEDYPVVIKPAKEGSSCGLFICKNKEEAGMALEKLEGKGKILIEEFIKGEEITVGVLNGESLGVIKIIPKSGVYDYDSKYTKGMTEFEVPAKLKEEIYKKILLEAEKIYNVLELKGGVRIDIIIKDDNLYFLEVNTIPGMTETSLLPKIASLKNYTFDDLVKKILEGF